MPEQSDELLTLDRVADIRRHPDLFTAREAAQYLRLDSERGLETCRTKYGLVGFTGVNRSMMYWREDLDRCALRIVGRDKTMENVEGGRLRIAGQRG